MNIGIAFMINMTYNSLMQRNSIFDSLNASQLTLDGHTAVLRGRLLDFPIVCTLPSKKVPNIEIQCSWESLEARINSSNFTFRSN